jgi:SET domain-containing protein
VPDDDAPFEIRPSPMQGLGAFATRHIPAGTRLVEYAGQRLTPAEADARYPDDWNVRHHTYLFAIDDDIVIDAAVDGNDARFINHACKPNCYTQVISRTIWIRAARNIKAGEELTYDYHTDGEQVIQCRCRPGCKRKL